MSGAQPNPTMSTDRVPLHEKIALGIGSLTAFFGFSGPERLAWPVFGMLLGVEGWMIGVSLLIPRLWDAVTDPIMGRISDNARTRFGRRRPFILAGALLMAVSFVMMWYVPHGTAGSESLGFAISADALTMAYFVVMQLVFYTAYTIYSVPYTALSYEMTPDYNERTRVMAYLGFFHKAGEFLSGWVPALMGLASAVLVVGATEMSMEGVHAVGWLLGLVVFACMGVVPAIFVRERFAQPITGGESQVKLIESMKAALSNRAFLVLVSVIIFNTLSGILASGIDQFVLVYYMGDGSPTAGLVQKGVLTTGYAFVGFASIPIITMIAGRLGKRGALYVVYWLMVVGSIAKWFVFQPGHPVVEILDVKVDPIILIDPILCGPMWVAVKILLASMMADICDEDELRHGQRREGLFGAAFSWLEKLVVSLAALGTGLALTMSGFDAELGTEQVPGTFMKMRLFLAGAPALTALFAIIALRFYPIDGEKASATRAVLEERRGRIDASGERVDP